MGGSELQSFAEDIDSEGQPRARWLMPLKYLLVLWGLGYLVTTAGHGGLDGPNGIFWVVLAFWLIYTPIAVRRKWPVI